MAIMIVPVTKGKGVIEFDTELLPESVYAEALLQGLVKVLVNRGQSKITVAELGDAETVKAESMLAAQKQKDKIMAGDIKFSGKAKATKASSGAVTIPRPCVSHVTASRMHLFKGRTASRSVMLPPKDITAAAKELIAADPSIIDLADRSPKGPRSYANADRHQVAHQGRPEASGQGRSP